VRGSSASGRRGKGLAYLGPACRQAGSGSRTAEDPPIFTPIPKLSPTHRWEEGQSQWKLSDFGIGVDGERVNRDPGPLYFGPPGLELRKAKGKAGAGLVSAPRVAERRSRGAGKRTACAGSYPRRSPPGPKTEARRKNHAGSSVGPISGAGSSCRSGRSSFGMDCRATSQTCCLTTNFFRLPYSSSC
jgi:hypothetical protein